MSVYYLNTTDSAELEAVKTETQSVEDQVQTQSEAQTVLAQFWSKVTDDIRSIRHMDLKQQVLPLARIKKIMKLDEDVKMISSEAPLLFAKAAEIFIQELTLRAWVHTEDNKRRTLQRNDIAMAISKYDQFDFLIDIVPREDIKPQTTKPRDDVTNRTGSSTSTDQVYYFQLAQQHNANLQGGGATVVSTPSTSSNQTSTSTIQVVQADSSASPVTVSAAPSAVPSNPQPLLIQTAPQTIQAPPAGNVQIVQQVVTPSGEIQQIPITLTAQQLQMIKMQLQTNSAQPVIIHTAPIATAAPQQLIQVAQQNATAAPVYITQTNGTTDGE